MFGRNSSGYLINLDRTQQWQVWNWRCERSGLNCSIEIVNYDWQSKVSNSAKFTVLVSCSDLRGIEVKVYMT